MREFGIATPMDMNAQLDSNGKLKLILYELNIISDYIKDRKLNRIGLIQKLSQKYDFLLRN